MSPFIKASKENSKKTVQRVISFGALETIDIHSDSMASLVSKLDMKLDKGKPNIDLRYIRVNRKDVAKKEELKVQG